MQRQPISPLIIILAVVAFLTACTPAAHYDGRLAAADSLMHDRPDSALAILQALHPDSLATQGDHAYRDLLLTQARYKCYITATTDSAINRALHYYRHHSHEQEKLTRAYIYKGAVMEELGHPDSAMHYYKTAEATAAPDDYFNLAYTNSRIADLFRIYDANGQTCFEKYKQAYQYYALTDNKQYECYSLYYMFMMEGTLVHYNNRQHDELFNKVIQIARQLNDKQTLFDTYELRSRQLSRNDSSCHSAKQIALYCLNNYPDYVNIDLYLDLAFLYAKESKVDSTKYFLQKAHEAQIDTADRDRILIRRQEVLAMIANCEGRNSTSEKYLAMNSIITDSIIDNSDKYGLDIIEKEFSQHKQSETISIIGRQKWYIVILLITAILTILAIMAAYLRRLHRTRAIISELRETTDAKIRELEQLQDKINDLDIQDNKLKDYFDSHLWVMREIIEQCYHIPNSKLVQKLKNTLCYQEQNKDQWTKLNFYIDMRYNHILSKTMKQYPQLNDRDILLVALTTLDFSCIQIAMILGYSNPTSIGVVRQRLAKKMGIDCTLKQYIDQQIHI